MKIAKYIVFIFIIQSVCLFSQGRVIDSLKLKLKTAKEDTSKVNTFNMLSAAAGWRVGNYDTASYYANQALKLSQTNKFKKGEADAFSNLGIIAYYLGNYSVSFKAHHSALNIRNEIKDKIGIAESNKNIGSVYYAQAKYPEALKCYLSSLKVREELNDKNGIAGCFGNLGNVYHALDNNTEAFKYDLQALNLFTELGDKNGMANSYTNVGSNYETQGNYPEALKHYSQSLELSRELNDKQGIGICYVNIGNIQLELKNYAEALNSYFSSLNIHEEIDDKQGIATACANIGFAYYSQKNGKEAKKWQQKSLELAKQMGDKWLIQNNYDALTLSDILMGNYKSALDNYQLYIMCRDSIYNEENVRKQTQSEMQYDFDKKELAAKAEQDKKDLFAEEEKQKQTIITSSIALGLIIVTVFAFFVFRSLRTTRKQKDIIELQKHEVEKQKTLVEIQKHEIEEKHKEITDSINYAERIQRSFLASDELLNTHLQDYFVLFQPKDVVSGDFYWAEKFVSLSGSDNFIMVTADSTGHGVPGAIMSLLNITSLELAIKDGFTEPYDILNATRKTIIERLKKDGSAEGGKDGMDCSLLMFDFKHLVLKIAAANNSVWIVRNSGTEAIEVLEIKPDKMPVGKHDRQGTSFTQQEVQLQSGDVVYTLTDGFPDQFGGEKGKKFMSKNLRELLASHSHLPMSQQKELLEKTFSNWVGNLEQIDDVTIIGVRI